MNSAGNNFNANVAANWQVNGQPANQLPGSNDNVVFDAKVSNKTIEWNQNFSVGTMSLQNGYSALQTIDAGVTVEDAGTYYEDGTSNLNLDFGDANSGFQLDAGGTITNMTLLGNRSAWFTLSGGVTSIAQTNGGFTDTIGVNFGVAANAKLTDWSGNALKFADNNLQIAVAGEMDVWYGSPGIAALIDNNGCSNDNINVANNGVLGYLGTGSRTDTFTVPVYVQTGGTFLVTAAPVGTDGGKLIVQAPNQAPGVSSVNMTGDSSVLLAHADTLECDNGYYQSAGSLETVDGTTCTLQAGKNSDGTVTIAGGALLIDNPTGGGGYGQFNVNCATLNFAGTYYTAIAGNQVGPNTSDLLNVTGTTNLQNGSSLVVTANAPLKQGSSWIILKDAPGNNIQGGNFTTITTNLPNPNPQLNTGIDTDFPIQYVASC